MRPRDRPRPPLADQPLLGIFFLACAAAQLGWTALVLVRPTRLLVEAAVVGNVALLAQGWTAGSVLLLALLSLSGAGA